MRKTFLLAITALVALMAASCQKEELGRVLTATIEQYEHNSKDGNGASKAYINDQYYACWENNDKVKINGTEYTVSISEGDEHNYSATIQGDVPTGQNLLAYYPASQVSGWNGDNVTITLPQMQNYEEHNGHQIINNPMAAYCPADSNKLKFRNLGALLKVTVSTSERVRAIEVKGVDNQILCGKAQLTFDNNDQPILGQVTGGTNRVSLQIPENVTPSSNTFYIVVPAGANFAQLTIAVLTTNGTTYTHHCKTSAMGQSLPRNQIGAVSYTPNGNEDDTFFPDWMIRYTGSSQVTPYSNSPFGEATIVNHTFSNGNGILLFDRPLSTIGDYAFQNCSSLTSIDLPESLTSIGDYAFQNCSSLASIDLPESLTSIGNYAFLNCSSLTLTYLPAGVTSIGKMAFSYCTSLTSITLPAGVTSIGKMAFSYCTSLTSITLPASLTSIGSSAFSGCYGLTSITLPASLESIGDWAFYGCSGLTSITLPENRTSIGNGAFEDCSSLTSISLPESLTSIGWRAFYECTSLTSISLPAGVTSIGLWAFYGCSSLKTVYVNRWVEDGDPQITPFGEDMFNDCPLLSRIYVPADAVDTYKTADGWREYSTKIQSIAK